MLMLTTQEDCMAYNSQALTGRPLIQVALTVRDQDRARCFYRDTLGLPLLFEAEGMMFFQLDSLRPMVGLQHEPGQSIGGSLLYFDAPDIDVFRGTRDPVRTVTARSIPASRPFSYFDGRP